MIAFSEASVSNLHLQRMKEACSQTEVPISWVVFADDDPVMLRRLAGALQREAAMILPIPQSLWDADHAILEEAILWLTKEREISNLVLVGNSAAGFMKCEPFFAGHPELERAEGLPALVSRAQRLSSQAEEHFARQVGSLLAIPEINAMLARGVLRVHSLYYRAECGVFAAYEPRTNIFRPLIR